MSIGTGIVNPRFEAAVSNRRFLDGDKIVPLWGGFACYRGRRAFVILSTIHESGISGTLFL